MTNDSSDLTIDLSAVTSDFKPTTAVLLGAKCTLFANLQFSVVRLIFLVVHHDFISGDWDYWISIEFFR